MRIISEKEEVEGREKEQRDTIECLEQTLNKVNMENK